MNASGGARQRRADIGAILEACTSGGRGWLGLEKRLWRDSTQNGVQSKQTWSLFYPHFESHLFLGAGASNHREGESQVIKIFLALAFSWRNTSSILKQYFPREKIASGMNILA